MRKITTVALIVTSAAGVYAFGRATDEKPPDKPKERTAAVHVTEDDPLWDCTTMGNQICGSKEVHAERKAIKYLQGLQEWCKAQGMAAETWVERHPPGESRLKEWFEVLGKCAGTFPFEGVH